MKVVVGCNGLSAWMGNNGDKKSVMAFFGSIFGGFWVLVGSSGVIGG